MGQGGLIMGWTDERVTLLRKLWAEGLSASQIAKQLGGVTRNAVIGKVHRLGLAGRATPSRPAKRPVRTARPRVMGPSVPRLRMPSTMPTVVIPDLEPLKFEDGKAANVLTLNESMCKFPIGDPTDPDFAFCGRGSSGGPYCSDHARLAYQPSQARKRRTAGAPDELRRMLRLAAM
ncbi:GcrA cell cycle regulator [Terricaulis silvestris]|uniref:GcrA cell cycle regulator n=2 Tax=Terricaulis silvestris TaxID=2686094 RepID=A0A6I6MRS1_9CAUL|nr:GcrA cell cycle regulator [Terricaulis silvestris]